MKRWINSAEWDGVVSARRIMKETYLDAKQAQQLSDYIYKEHLDEGFSSINDFLNTYDLEDLYENVFNQRNTNEEIQPDQDIPEILADLDYIFLLNSTNSTWNDDILRVVESFGGIKVRYGYFDKDGHYFSRQNTSWRFAVTSGFVAGQIWDKVVKELHIPVHQDMLYVDLVDWSKCYDIQIDDYSKGIITLDYHKDRPQNA